MGADSGVGSGGGARGDTGDKEDKRGEERPGGWGRGDGRGRDSCRSGRQARGQLAAEKARENGSPGPEPGGYLSEEAGDHLLEGVLVHLVHLHRDPHPRAPPRPPRLRERRATRAPPGLQAATRGRPKGRGFFPSSFKLCNFIVREEKQTSGHVPALFRQRPLAAAERGRRARPSGPRRLRPESPGAAGTPSPPRGLRTARPWSLGLWDLCLCVITWFGATG